jgi:hypothetical protein
MPSPFVPFLKSRAGTAPAASPVATDSARVSAAFTALKTGGTSESAACAHAPAAGAQPVVTLEKDGDRVTRIRIECTCGQVIELDCEY